MTETKTLSRKIPGVREVVLGSLLLPDSSRGVQTVVPTNRSVNNDSIRATFVRAELGVQNLENKTLISAINPKESQLLRSD